MLLSFVGQVFAVVDSQFTSCGTVVNLSRDDTMGLVVSGLQMQLEVRVYPGSMVVGITSLTSVIIGDFALGSMVDPLGTMLLNVWKPKSKNQWVIDPPAIGIVDRQSVFEPLQFRRSCFLRRCCAY